MTNGTGLRRAAALAVALLGASVLALPSALARPGSGHGNGMGHGAEAHGNANAGMTPNGGMSSSHISAQGAANTNGPNADARLFGTERADQRHSMHSTKKSSHYIHTSASPNGGHSSAHISEKGAANTNGPNADTRLHGTVRAEARHDRDKPHD